MALKLLPTGVPGLDEVLGGGLPEYSFNLLAGRPGSGKTTLIHQLTFANASSERPALYFTVVGEPALKMLRYQQQMSFFDRDKAGTAIRFVDLGQEVLTGDLARVLDKVVRTVEEVAPSLVVVDSFRSLLPSRQHRSQNGLEQQSFLTKLALHLTSWHATSVLVGEYGKGEMKDNPVFAVADGIIWLSQHRERNSTVRKLEIIKMRGSATMPGLHTFRMSEDGVRIFPRVTSLASQLQPRQRSASRATPRAAFGVPGLDEMLGGGLPAGDATLVAGPSGIGKSVLSAHFITHGVQSGEPGVLAVFEEQPDEYLDRAEDMGFPLRSMVEQGSIAVLNLKPLDLSAEEILHRIQQMVVDVGAKRLVIDSLNGVELALSPTARDDFREALYRAVSVLTGSGISVVMTVEVMESFSEIKFSPHAISFLSQNIIFLRYVEIASGLQRMLTVVKMRRSHHSSQMREFKITQRGAMLLSSFRGYQGLLTGVPQERPEAASYIIGLDELDQQLLDRLAAHESATAGDLSRRLRVDMTHVKASLQRLLDLHYIVPDTDDGETRYRVIERPLGTTKT